jgi:hypothetical protein
VNVALRGSSPAVLASGILLLSRARQLGQRLTVEIVGDPDDIGVVRGPAVLHSAPLASCGVGRESGSGALVVVPGPPDEPLAVSLSADGRGEWFLVDRTGAGADAATRAWVRLGRDPRPQARILARQVRRAAEHLGCVADPAVLDLLFGAPVAPLARLAVALRAGRALSGLKGAPVTAVLVGELAEGDEGVDVERALSRLAPGIAGPAREALQSAARLAREDGDPSLVDAVSEILCHLALLPTGAILPPLDPAMDAVAFGLGRGLAATTGCAEAQASLLETYRFLGGKFCTRADWPVDLPSDAPPEDRLGRWRWFCGQVSVAAERAERVWRDLVDPPM